MNQDPADLPWLWPKLEFQLTQEMEDDFIKWLHHLLPFFSIILTHFSSPWFSVTNTYLFIILTVMPGVICCFAFIGQ